MFSFINYKYLFLIMKLIYFATCLVLIFGEFADAKKKNKVKNII